MSTFRFNATNPIVDSQGRATNEFLRALPEFVQAIVTAQLAAAAAAVADGKAVTAQSAAEAAAAEAASKQPASTSLTALAALSSTGLVEQTGPNAFTDRAIGVAASNNIPTRADADGRYVRSGQTAHPSYSPYGGQTVSAAYVQAEAQATDNAVKAASTAIDAINSKLQTIAAFT